MHNMMHIVRESSEQVGYTAHSFSLYIYQMFVTVKLNIMRSVHSFYMPPALHEQVECNIKVNSDKFFQTGCIWIPNLSRKFHKNKNWQGGPYIWNLDKSSSICFMYNILSGRRSVLHIKDKHILFNIIITLYSTKIPRTCTYHFSHESNSVMTCNNLAHEQFVTIIGKSLAEKNRTIINVW